MRRSVLALLVCCGSFAAVTYVKANYPNVSSDLPVPLAEVRNRPNDTDVSNVGLKYPPISHFREITDRPLFSPSRRPARTADLSPMDAYRLRGVLVSNRRKTGLLERRSDGMSIPVHEGDIVDTWQIVLIDTKEIVWSDSAQFHTMRITQAQEGETSRPFEESINVALDEARPDREAYIPGDAGRRSDPASHRRQKPNRRAMSNALAFPSAPPPLPPLAPSHRPKRRG